MLSENDHSEVLFCGCSGVIRLDLSVASSVYRLLTMHRSETMVKLGIADASEAENANLFDQRLTIGIEACLAHQDDNCED